MESMFETIKGKRVLVTGASSGIGASIAKLFASYGAFVGLHYRKSKLQAMGVLREWKNVGGKMEIFQGDLLKSTVRKKLIKSFVEVFGGIDILINNAGGIYNYKHFSEIDENSWDNTFNLNTKAPFFLSVDAFEYMKKQRWGRIINITTTGVKYVGAKSMHYTASKAALDTLTLGFAREGAQYNILVNSIRCGVIDTTMHKRIDGYSEEQFQKRISLIPLKRIGMPIYVARMALFLASECGDFITGEIFTVAGGD